MVRISNAAIRRNIYILQKKVGIRVAKNLVSSIIKEPDQLIKNPQIGQVEELLQDRNTTYRYLVYKNYKIIYSVNQEQGLLQIADVFDTRQNPPKLKRILK